MTTTHHPQAAVTTAKKRQAVDLSAHYNVVTVLPPQQPTKPNELATYHYLDETGQPFEKRQRVQRGGLRSCAKVRSHSSTNQNKDPAKNSIFRGFIPQSSFEQAR